MIAAAFGALTAWSWKKWVDPHIDFGNELYVAWQVSEGQALYRDIALRHGPLSHALNGLWFTLFGASVRTLALCNLAIFAGICAMAYRTFRLACDRLTATTVVLALLGVFGFSQYVGIANYNYVAPYHHYQTHAIALGLAMSLSFGAALRTGRAAWAALAGACLGLVFLTKLELFVPALLAAVAGTGLLWAAAPPGRVRVLFALRAAVLLPPGLFFAWLASQMSLGVALRGVLGNWAYLGGPSPLEQPFYAHVMGIDEPIRNLVAMVAAFAALALLSGVTLLADRAVPVARARAFGVAAGLGLFGMLVLLGGRMQWLALARALPITAALACGWLLHRCLALRGDREALAKLAPLAVLTVFGLGLLGKIVLRARFDHYGFALAMPATLVLVATLVWWLPSRLGQGRGAVTRALSLAVVAGATVGLLSRADVQYRHKAVEIGQGADRILAQGGRARILRQTLGRLDELAGPGETLLVLPEGVSLNYWLRMRNPSRYNLYLPTEIGIFGEDDMLADWRAHPPDWVALVHRNSGEFGTGPFGSDPRNGRALMQWVGAHYEPVERFGGRPFRDEGFGVALLRRADTLR